MNRLRIKAVAAGCAPSERPMVGRDARHESMESEGSITTAASKKINNFELE